MDHAAHVHAFDAKRERYYAVLRALCRELAPRYDLVPARRDFAPLSLDALGEARLSTLLYDGDRYRLGLVTNAHEAPVRVRLAPDDRHWLRLVMTRRPVGMQHPDLATVDEREPALPDPNLSCVGIEMPPPLVAKMRRFEARLEQAVHETWSQAYPHRTPPRLASAFESPFRGLGGLGGDLLLEANAPEGRDLLRPGWSVFYAHVDKTRLRNRGPPAHYGAPVVHLDSLGAKGERREAMGIGDMSDLKLGSAVLPTLRAALFVNQAPAKLDNSLFHLTHAASLPCRPEPPELPLPPPPEPPPPDQASPRPLRPLRTSWLRQLTQMVVDREVAETAEAAEAAEAAPPVVQLVWFLDEVVVYTNLTNDHASTAAGDLDCAERMASDLERRSRKRRRDDDEAGHVSVDALDEIVDLAGEIASSELCTYTEADEERARAVAATCEAIVAEIDAPAGVLAPQRARAFERLYDA